MSEFEATAERIIRSEGLTFALAAVANMDGDLREARDLLKQAIVKALAEAASAAGKEKVSG